MKYLVLLVFMSFFILPSKALPCQSVKPIIVNGYVRTDWSFLEDQNIPRRYELFVSHPITVPYYFKRGTVVLDAITIYSKDLKFMLFIKTMQSHKCFWDMIHVMLNKVHCGYLYVIGGTYEIEESIRAAIKRFYYKKTRKVVKVDVLLTVDTSFAMCRP